jgi:hypothetical protein
VAAVPKVPPHKLKKRKYISIERKEDKKVREGEQEESKYQKRS